jgi:type IX secretion system PorP/SprF family membrane protein
MMQVDFSFERRIQDFLTCCLLLALASPAWAQQLARQTQFVQNPFLVNPAFAGTELGTFGSLSHREQWVGFQGAPSTSSVTVTSSLPNRFGVGISVERDDQGGAYRRTGIELAGTYTIDLNNEDAVAFGIGLMGRNSRFDGSDLNLWQPDDPAITGAVESSFAFDSRFGLMVFGQYYQFGLAVSNLLQSPFGLESEPTDERNRGIRHYALTGRYDYTMDAQWVLQPAVMMRFTEITPIQLDLNVRALYQNRYWGGLGFRQGDALVLMAGAAFQDIQVGYSYDAGTGVIGNLSPSTHEITVSYVVPRRGAGFTRRGMGGRLLDRNLIIRN